MLLARLLFAVIGALTTGAAEFMPVVLTFLAPASQGIVLPWFVGCWGSILPALLALALLLMFAPSLPRE